MKGVENVTEIQTAYQTYFDKIGTAIISKEAQVEIMKRPQSWNRYYEQAVLNTIQDGELPKSESRFYQSYFEDAHERISFQSLEKIVEAMKESGVKMEVKDGNLRITSTEMDKTTLLGWLADLFPKHG